MAKVSEFYQELSSKGMIEELKNKLENVHNEKEYNEFVREEILPRAESMGYDFCLDDIVSYDESIVISEEELANVADDSKLKNVSRVMISALTLF